MSAPVEGIDYAELHCLSNFSFQRGASSAAELRSGRRNSRAWAAQSASTARIRRTIGSFARSVSG